MNVKQKGMLIALVLTVSVLFVVTFVSLYPFALPNGEIPEPPLPVKITISGSPTLDQPTTPDYDGSIALKWSDVSGAEAYQLYMMKDGVNYIVIRLTTITSFTKHGLINGVYRFKVRGYNTEGYSYMSNFRIVIVTDPPLEIPDAPFLDEITPKPNSDGEISLEWNVVSGATKYRIYRSKDGGSVDTLMPQDFSENYYYDSVLEDGVYSYKVKAGNNAGYSDFSNEESVTVAISEPDPAPDAPILRLMVNSPSIDGEIELEWDLVSGATMYTIFRWKDGIDSEILKQDFSEIYYYDSVLEDGVYSYKVKAGNSEMEYSEYSNEVSITVQIPEAPDVPYMNQLEYEIINYTVKVYIDWEAVDCDSYVLYRSFNGEVYKPVEDGVYSTTGYSEILAEVGTYVYKVSAVNIYGESELSNSVTAIVTKEGVTVPTDDYTMLYILLGVLGVLLVPMAIILVKRKKRRS